MSCPYVLVGATVSLFQTHYGLDDRNEVRWIPAFAGKTDYTATTLQRSAGAFPPLLSHDCEHEWMDSGFSPE